MLPHSGSRSFRWGIWRPWRSCGPLPWETWSETRVIQLNFVLLWMISSWTRSSQWICPAETFRPCEEKRCWEEYLAAQHHGQSHVELAPVQAPSPHHQTPTTVRHHWERDREVRVNTQSDLTFSNLKLWNSGIVWTIFCSSFSHLHQIFFWRKRLGEYKNCEDVQYHCNG